MSSQSKPSENLLVISAIGSDRPGIVDRISNQCSSLQCNIVDSRMTVLGGEFAIIMMVSGSWDAIAKLEVSLPNVCDELKLRSVIKQTAQRTPQSAIAYSVSVVALDNPGIVHEIAQFFSKQEINIEDMQTGTYSAPHTGTQMFSLSMMVNIPADMHIASLRDEFMDFCDELNLDAVIEPYRAT